ncbi:hypothetical protein AGDE_08309 [Angomonas deanei]|uniref:JAB1/Mov34/MPN/PAD-1 ubiquitin protease, putative n=1 Tax=Angomonas deanei TaxID=59799 RepID=A0A7G2CGN2_9TRYP|nr:hypothetical protein AGDE_08309 [Angomonas deanei]CAD2217342.1 JAB1/Mov34/MPN/PAD-1 ubiquitin protease, putative [Angomonas deanei]|eukprot:EPY33386.1 hypothetical protein AGDE_08309 [Angomonas deanei]
MSDPGLIISPNVASAILEHAKRKRQVTGYILGTRANNKYVIKDCFPLTQTGASRTEDIKRFIRNKKLKEAFVKGDVLGWYSAGWADPHDGEDSAEVHFKKFCETPSHVYMEKNNATARSALHLHCALPESGRLNVQWTAHVTTNRRENDKYESIPVAEVGVGVIVEDKTATNVVMQHIREQLQYNGQPPAPQEPLVNLDEVSLRSREELLAVERQLHQLLSQVDSGDADTKSAIETLHRAREEQTERQLTTDDALTRRLKEALMMKCMATLLQEHVARIGAAVADASDEKRGDDFRRGAAFNRNNFRRGGQNKGGNNGNNNYNKRYEKRN